MSALERVTLTGGITFIGEVRKTNSGKSVVNIGIILSYDKRNDDGTWEAGAAGKYTESLTLYGALADHAVVSFQKGDQVIVMGDRVPKPDYTDKSGVQHTGESQINVRAMGPDIMLKPWTTERKAGTGTTTTPAPKPAPAPAPKPAPAELDEDDEW